MTTVGCTWQCARCVQCVKAVSHTHTSALGTHTVCVCVYADTQERMKHSRVGFTAQ